MSVKEDAYRYAVKNAFLHNGKAELGALVGKVVALHKEIDLKKLMPELQKIVEQVNEMGFREIKEEYEKFSEKGYELKPKEKTEELPVLEWAKKEKVVTRYAPNPNGPFHLGNARAAVLSDEFAKRYGGKFILRFEDTDPKVKKPMEDAEKIFNEDLQWLQCEVHETFFASDRLELYYGYMKKLIGMEKAYVCTCKPEQWRKLTAGKTACGCRNLSSSEHMKHFDEMMKNKLHEGQAVLRIKTDLMHPDPSVRDWWIARVVDSPQHPRAGSKHHVWPSYMFQSAIDDHEMKVTLILRGQEHSQNQTKQECLYKYFGWSYPHSFHFGRIKLDGMVLSTSRIKEGIELGVYSGWDDIRLGTIKALRRRGFDPRALRQSILDVGVKSSDATIEISRLADLNKHFVEAVSERLPFFEEPIRLDVSNTVAMELELDGRNYCLREPMQSFIVSKKEMEKYKAGDVIRLRNAYNVKITRVHPLQVFAECVGQAKTGKPTVYWMLQHFDVVVLMPDNSKRSGLSDAAIAGKKPGDMVYLDGLGFCRVDAVDERNAVLWFTHN